MRILDKILYKTKLQTGGNLAGKVIKKEDGYFENPDGIANSPTIDRKNYTSIDKTKVNKGVYNYKGVDYLLDYIPTNMTSYGVSETYTKPAAPATTSTNTVPSNPKFMPKAHFSTNMALSPNKPLVLGINKDKGVFQRASVEAENNFPLTRGVTVQQSVSSSDMQPVSTPVTTTIPEKKKGLFNRIFGKRDNKLTTSDNATNITSTTNNTDTNSKTALPARANTSLSQVPVLGVPTNNSTSANTTSVFDPDKINTYTLDNMGNIVDENGNVISFKSNKEKKAASEMFRSSDKNVKKVSTISNIASTTPTSVATTQNPIQSTTTNSSIPVPAQQNPPLPVLGDKSDKVTTTLNKEEYSYNSHLPLGENIFEGKKYKYNGKTGNIIKSDGTVIQVDPRVKKRLDMVFNMPYTDGHAAFSLEEQELALNEAGDANGVYKEGNFVSGEDYGKNETTNNPTPVPGLTLPPNISAATSSQTESRLPVIDTKAPIKPKPIYSAQQPANVQPEVSTQSFQNTTTSSVPNNNAESNKTQTQEINYFEEGKLTRDKPYYSVSKYADEALNISNITDRPLNMPLTNKVDKNGNAIPEYGKTLYPVIETKDGELKYSKGDHDNWNVPGYDNWTEDDAVKDENGNWVYKTIPAELQRKGEYLPPIDPDGMNKLRKSSLYSSLFDINGVKGKDIRRREEFITKKLKEGSPLSTEDKIYLRLTRPNINLFSEYDVKTGTLIPPYKLTEKDLKRYDRGKYIPEVVERYTQEYDKEKRNMTDVKKAEHAREKERGIYNNQYARMDALHAEVNIDREEKAEFNTMNANQRQKKIEEMEEIERAYKNMKPAPNAKILTPATEESPAIYSAYVPTKVVGNIIKNKIYTPEEISAGQMYYWEKRKGYLYLKEHYKPKNKNQTGGYINKTKYRFI